MECGLRAGWPLVFAVSLALAACKPQAPAPVERPVAQRPTGSVSISGGDELAQVLSWSLPPVQLEAGGTAAARARAMRALAAGDLFVTPDSGIPLLVVSYRLATDRAG